MRAPDSTPSDLVPFLSRVSLFAGLDHAALALLARASHSRRVPKNALLFSQGDDAEAAFVVYTGSVAIVLTTSEGRELVINEMQPGDCLGEMALLTGAVRSAAAVASVPTELIVIPRDAFMAELEREPRLMRQLLAIMSERLRASSQREGALAFLDAAARLARLLLQLDRAATAAGYLTISQEELARRIGATRQTTARILGQWRRRGWILTGRGHIVVLDRAALRKALEQA